MKNKHEKMSLKKRLLLFTILCWGGPILIFFSFITISYKQGIVFKSEQLMEIGVNQATDLMSVRISEAIKMSQKPTYEKVWENDYKSYKNNEIDKNSYIQRVNISLVKKFHVDNRFGLFAFYVYGSNKPDCYSARNGYPYKNYLENVNDEILEYAESKSNYTKIVVLDERIFIVRNLYSVSKFKQFGTLVIELNQNYLTKYIKKDLYNQMILFINDAESMIVINGKEEIDNNKELLNQLVENYNIKWKDKVIKMEDKKYSGFLAQKSYENYHLGVAALALKNETYSSLYDFYRIIVFVLILFIPIIIYGIIFLNRQIQTPVSILVSASKEIEKGNIGFEIEDNVMMNKEFQYLLNSFNSMSSQVKYLFDYVYDEKLAKKDAQILALQAQINPHFLNNTLEMMNWQARMAGDIIVSKMIESLGTVLDYRMNRSNVKEIYLVEELKCVDAYFYIMSMRFGQRLQIIKKVDEDVLYLYVPPLILQPLIENAIIYGVETVKSGIIEMNIYHANENVCLEVKNSGKGLDKIQQEKINKILNSEESETIKGSAKHTSIGIRNVNKRIKLMYGEEFGLDIFQEEEFTVSKITIPFKKKIVEEEKEKERERERVEIELEKIRTSKK